VTAGPAVLGVPRRAPGAWGRRLRAFRQGACTLLFWAVLVSLCVGAAHAATPMTREHALRSLNHAVVHERAAAVARLAEAGTMADAPAVAGRLRDEDPGVRRMAGAALWMIWSRSGDPATDRLFQRGVAQMSDGRLTQALATFSQVVRRKPDFAEGWNKRATVHFLLGDHAASLKDCDEVLKRNPLHFGALSGMAQIHLQRGDPIQALRAYERALQANPNLDGGAEMLQILEEAARRKGGTST
jgi:tetratricopeptide (TPR) repeat protein